jgi:hypothetical protein
MRGGAPASSDERHQATTQADRVLRPRLLRRGARSMLSSPSAGNALPRGLR